MGNEAQETDATAAVDFKEVQSTPRFQELRKRHRSFVFPMAIAFLLWYFAYVLLADYAVEFMSTKVWGNINIGLLMGLLIGWLAQNWGVPLAALLGGLVSLVSIGSLHLLSPSVRRAQA